MITKAAIETSHNPDQNDHTKHIEIDRHFIKQNLEGVIKFSFVRSEDQQSDVLTKAVSSKDFQSSLVIKLGMKDIFAPT